MHGERVLEFIAKRRRRSMRLADGRVIEFPAVMGVLNVTPDSFSDGGRYFDCGRAVARALEMEAEGAAIIDVGGESTRPGAPAVPAALELERIVPVLRALGGKLRVPISIDTRKAEVAAAALAEGAAIVNDVSGFEFDPGMAKVTANGGAAAVLMHMRGTPGTMMRQAHYRDVVGTVREALSARARSAIAAGVRPSRIILDPGLGFAKQVHHSLRLLGALPRLCTLGYPILVGASRKSLVRATAGAEPAALEFGTAAASAIAIFNGAAIVRVHEVAAAVAVTKMVTAIKSSCG